MALTPSLTFSDMIYLKNKSTIEGIIEKEDENKITLNMGYGKLALLKKDIEYIDRYNLKEETELRNRWHSQYFTRPEFIPAYLQDIAIEFNKLGGLRDAAIKAKLGKDKTAEEIKRLENELKESEVNLAGVSDKLTRLKPEDNQKEYNSLVEEFNSLVAKIKLLEYNKDGLHKQIGALDKKTTGYLNDFNLFRKKFRDIYETLGEGAKEQNRYFFAGINKKLNELDNDFTRHAIDYDRYGSNIVVEALLNDWVKARLVVDTGASLVIISGEVADKLGLNLNKEEPSLIVTLADGREVKANPVILESLKVKDAELKNVRAAVLKDKVPTQDDGLLGMSFLENFLLSLDVRTNRLILEEFYPKEKR
jgi:clan AA aspartic protease (TIGR02281 family)